MRINKIRINGFKSFVDSISINLPNNLTGIVGPNGCGKSNIIDALTWVLGETSAKQLRGESMEDVIFNGSGSRQEVSRASVEILLDNTDGAVGDKYSAFSEISVKRELIRESQSSYLINGVRCRRKDITDLFLGTGVGSRQYSVIGQGMISRIAEAKPEEMRGFLEEAAGISKYKERRRETENKIKQSRANIARINDLQGELQTQLNKLDRQAKEAKRYNKLKDEENFLQKKILGFRWVELEGKRKTLSYLKIATDDDLKVVQKKIMDLDSNISFKNSSSEENLKVLGEIHAEFYKASAEITRIEDGIKENEKRRMEAKSEQALIQEKIEHIRTDAANSKKIVEDLEKEITTQNQRISAARLEIEKAEELLEKHTEDELLSREQLEVIATNCQQLERVRERLRLQVQHNRENLSSNKNLMSSLSAEIEKLEKDDPESYFEKTEKAVDSLGVQRDHLTIQKEQIRKEIANMRLEIDQRAKDLHESKKALEEEKGRYSSLKTLQDSAHGDEGKGLNSWMAKLGIADVKRLVETVQIEKGWEVAFERALTIPVNAYVKTHIIENLKEKISQLDTIPTDITFVDGRDFDVTQNTSSLTMSSKIKSAPSVIKAMTENILIVDNVDNREALPKNLRNGEIAVSKEGTIFGNGWISLANKDSEKANLLLREVEINRLADGLKATESQLQQTENHLINLNNKISDFHIKEKNIEDLIQRNEREAITTKEQYLELKAKKAHRADHLIKIKLEKNRIDAMIEKETQNESELLERLAVTERKLKDSHDGRDESRVLHKDEEIKIESIRSVLIAKRDGVHSLEIQRQNYKSHRDTTQLSIRQNDDRQKDFEERLEKLASTLVVDQNSKQEEVYKIETAFQEKSRIEKDILIKKQSLSVLEKEIKELSALRKNLGNDLDECKSKREKLLLEDRSLEVLQEEVVRMSKRLDVDIGSVANDLEEGDNEKNLEEELNKVSLKIERLGPLNLAAIEEFSQLETRKNHLDKQNEDLEKALDNLIIAIKRIDNETKNRFKEIFDQTNQSLTGFFGKLFGGGSARLVLTEENLLETGVIIVARPPGKRNTNISQLSGGEKALTALSIVFTIFSLKPSPFCLLDEVDAPLDDSNVVRYADMISEMAKTVQFLFVTHNKLTMEIADQLVGITMEEPGVSRMVSVDVPEALKLVESA